MKRLSALILASLMLLTAAVPLSVSAEEDHSDFAYEVMEDCVYIFDYLGSDTAVSVPAEIEGKPVKAFFTSSPNYTVTELTLPEGLQELGHSCLMDWTALEEVNLPSTLTVLGQSALIHAPKLEEIHVADGNRYMTDIDGVLYCAIDTYQVDETGMPLLDEPMVRIGYDIHAYPAGRAGESYEISPYAAGYDVIEVAERAFSDADNLGEIFIPSTVDTVHYAAFEKCDALTTVEFAAMEGILLDDEYESAIFGYKYDDETGDTLPGWRDDLTLVCYEGSAADRYASANGITARYFGDEIPASGGASAEINGTVPAGTMLIVADTSSHEEEIGILTEGKRYTSYDISLLCDGSYIQPNGTVTVFLPVPEGMNGASCKVYHYTDGAFVDTDASFIGGQLIFTTDHFSLFVIVDEGESENITVYFDNSEAQWENVIVFYTNSEDTLYPIGNIHADENGLYAVDLPADAVRVCFQNYWVEQPEDKAPEGGFLGTDFIPVEDGKTYSYSPTDESVYDVNGDGTVNSKDLTRLMKYIAGEQVEVFSADINEDGAVSAKDLTRLMKYIAGAL